MISSKPFHHPSPPNPESVFALLQAESGSVWLDDGRADSGWTIIAWHPETIATEGEGWPQTGRALTGELEPSPLPFTTGCIGYIGYHAAHHTCPVPQSRPTPEPEVWLAQYKQSLCYRHSDRQWFITGSATVHQQATELLNLATKLEPPHPADPMETHCQWSSENYQSAIQHILGLLHEGDCYQINLSRTVHIKGQLDPWECYRRLRRASSAGFGALLNLDGKLRILSSSPELLLHIEDRTATSIPIKGTRPRGNDPKSDQQLIAELLNSPKEKAELTMIVDLVRNDLGRIASPGSVRAHSRQIDSHDYVHHASQQVEATLSDNNDAWDCLQALFPAGSVTGAPKIRACQRIHELEPEGRGVYCGSIGYVSASGQAQWSVAIRTAIHQLNDMRFHIGGGIVEASIPQEEWEETIHKARAMAQAFTGSTFA